MPILEQNRPSNLGLDIRAKNPGLAMLYTPMTTEMQANLEQDVKALVAEYLLHLKAPTIGSDAWAASTVEILSEKTNQYIQKLESLLQEAANDTNDDDFAAKITSILR